MNHFPQIRGTTILTVRRGENVVMAGDGQVTFGESIVMKGNARKVRRFRDRAIVSGFAGATADAFTLEERFEGKLEHFNNDLTRAAVELARDWRMERNLRRLEAMLIVADKKKTFLISGTGDVIEPEKGVMAIGSGGNYAYAAALAYLDREEPLPLREIAEKSLRIAGEICVYTNQNIIVEEL